MVHLKRSKIKKVLGALLGFALIASGSFYKAKKEMLSTPNITGLFFHNPPQKVFKRSIDWLRKNNCTFLSTPQLVAILKNKNALPPRSVWVTFDDGWAGNMQEVLPVIKEYNLPVTFFISTAPIEEGFFWFNLVRKFEKELPLFFKGKIRDLWSIEENRRKQVVTELWGKVRKDYDRDAMTVDDIKYLSKFPNITIGAHTVNHAITTNCTPAELNFEITQSQKKLEEWTGKKVNFFAYPNGNFSGQEKEILKKSWFTLATTTEKRFISLSDDPYLIPRFVVNDDAFFSEQLCQMVGIWWWFLEKFNLNKVLNKRKRRY